MSAARTRPPRPPQALAAGDVPLRLELQAERTVVKDPRYVHSVAGLKFRRKREARPRLLQTDAADASAHAYEGDGLDSLRTHLSLPERPATGAPKGTGVDFDPGPG